MVSRENHVILASMVLFMLVLIPLLSTDFGDDNLLFALLLFVGVPVLLPQLYLAVTDDTISVRSRVWTIAGVTLYFVASFAWNLPPERRRGVLAVGGLAILGVVAFEFWTRGPSGEAA